jgi:hypothetical protein
MLRTICTAHLPTIITRLAPMAILTRVPLIYHYSTSRNIFEPSKDDDNEGTMLTKKLQLPDDKPWDGEEPVNHSVLRMIMDKYRHPLRVEGAAKRNLPRPQSNYVAPPSPSPQKEEKSSQLKKIEREKKQIEMKQKRLLNAKDSAMDYLFERKYPTPVLSEEKVHVSDNISKSRNQKDMDWEDWDLEEKPRSIEDLGVLSDARIRAARARGEFDDLSGRGKPLVEDPLINNPFIDRTEYFLNRIIQRNGAAPPWVIMQQEVDTEITTIRYQMNSAVKRCMEEMKQQADSIEKWSLLKQFNHMEKSFFEKEMDRLNKRLRSYNVMCPEPVRKKLLKLDEELQSVIQKHGFH